MTNEEIRARYNKWNEDFQIRFKEKHPEAKYFIWDGLFSPVEYYNSYPRILFINKEAYDEEEYDLVADIRAKIEKGQPFWKKQVGLKASMKKELAVIYAVHNDSKLSAQEMVEEYKRIDDFSSDLLSCAYINIKKSDGLNKSNIVDLAHHAQMNIDFICEQIRFFNPDIIIGGNVVDGILDTIVSVWEESIALEDGRNVQIHKLRIGDETYPFIDMPHPSSCLVDADMLREAMLQASSTYPTIWHERKNRDCFNMFT